MEDKQILVKEPRQFSLFFEGDMSPGDDPSFPEKSRTFETDVTRVIHSGLVMRPIYELETKRLRQSEDDDRHVAWESLDVIWIAFAILDVVSEMTEYNIGVSREDVIEKILPLAEKQAAAQNYDLTHEAVMEVLHKIFDHLVNRENRYLPFEYNYFDGALGEFVTRKFWLIKAVYTGEGKTALYTLTEEGYTAYFGLHETGALDAAAIGNLRIKLLIERGNVDDAIMVAKQNRKQCMRKSHELKAIRRAILRNIRSVDFEKLNTLADEGVYLSTQIQQESSRLHHLVRNKLANISQNKADNTRNLEQQHKLQILGENLEKLNHRLLELSSELQRLPDEYDRHCHKLFRRVSYGIMPPSEEVLRRVCLLEETTAANIGQEFMARFDPPVCRPLFDPASVIEACDRALERQNPLDDHRLPIQEIEEEPLQYFESELTEKLMTKAFQYLGTTVHATQGILLSKVLKAASKDQDMPIFPVAMAMAVFQCIVDVYQANKWLIEVALKEPQEIFCLTLPDGRQYRGHELILKTPSDFGISPRK